MPIPEHSDRYQAAVLWQATGIDSYGQATVGSPIEVRVRWNDKRSEMTDPNRNTITVDATANVYQDIAVGSRMWLGTLADWTASGITVPDNGVLEVKAFNATPDLKNRYQQRTVGMMRFRNTP